MRMLANIVFFKIGWLACVLSAANGQPVAGAAVVMVIIAWHLQQAQEPANELMLIAGAVAVGGIWDSLLAWQGWLVYPNGQIIAGTAPFWILLMWANFATTLNVSLRWMRGRWMLASLFGAIGGPLAYRAGEWLGAVEITAPGIALTALAIGWAVMMPLLVLLATRLDGFLQVQTARTDR